MCDSFFAFFFSTLILCTGGTESLERWGESIWSSMTSLLDDSSFFKVGLICFIPCNSKLTLVFPYKVPAWGIYMGFSFSIILLMPLMVLGLCFKTGSVGFWKLDWETWIDRLRSSGGLRDTLFYTLGDFTLNNTCFWLYLECDFKTIYFSGSRFGVIILL